MTIEPYGIVSEISRKRKIKLWLAMGIVLIALFALIFNLYAEEPEKVSTDLPSLIKEALNNNPSIKSARASWQAAKHRVPQSSALPDPTAGYSFMGPDLETPLGPQQEIYEFEQMIPFPGKLIEKRKMSQAESKASEAQYNLTERDIILKVSETYYDLYSVQETLQVTEEILELLKRNESIAQSRYASQAGSQRDVAKAQAEVSETLERVFMLRQERDTLTALLNSLLNSSGKILGKIAEPTLPNLPSTVDELLSRANENRPELREAEAMEKRETHAKTLAHYENAPDFSIGFQYYRIGIGDSSSPDAGQDAWMIPLKVTIPLWQNRIGPGILEARNNLKSAQAKLVAVQNETEYEVKRAYYRFNTQKQIVELYQNALIPEAELAYRSDQSGYEAGQTDILNLIDSQRVFLNAKVAYYQALAEALKSYAAIERTIGADLSSSNLTSAK